jgi:hypothetical protein
MEFHHVGIDLTPCLPYKFRRDGFHASRCVLLIVGTEDGIGRKEDTNMTAYVPPTKGVWNIKTIDPRRISERYFGGPHFAEFLRIEGTPRMICPKTADVFDMRAIAEAVSEGRNLAPVSRGAMA